MVSAPSVTARRWYLDVNTGTHGSPTWTGVFGIEDFKPAMDPEVKDDSDYNSSGYKSSTISAIGWNVEMKLARKSTAAAATAYDPGQEVLRAASMLMGASNRVEVRFYEMEPSGPRVEAYQGYAAVSWTEDGGDMATLATITVKLTGQGVRTSITHPDAAAVPKVYSVTPATGTTAGGALTDIIGGGFTGLSAATAVKFGVTNAASFVVVDDFHIVALTPAHAGGAVTVYITNGTGPSIDVVQYTFA